MYILLQVINDFIEKDYVIIIDGKLIRQDYGGEFGVYDFIRNNFDKQMEMM